MGGLSALGTQDLCHAKKWQ